MDRRIDDENDDGVLSRRARPAWGLINLIASVLAGAVAVLAAGRVLAIKAAEEVVRPVERRIDDHLAQIPPTRELMMRYVDEERESRKMLMKKVDALCRASPHANCPLGER